MRLRRIGLLGLVASLVAIAACGSNPNQPSNQIPNVAGSYSGTMNLTIPLAGVNLNCPASLSVTQSGGNLDLSPLTLGGACASILPTFPLGTATVDSTGSIGGATENNIFVASCNGDYDAVGSGGFFGSSLQMSLAYTAVSGGCVADPGNFTVSVNVSH